MGCCLLFMRAAAHGCLQMTIVVGMTIYREGAVCNFTARLTAAVPFVELKAL